MRIAVLNNNTIDSDFSRRFPDDGQKVVAGLQPLRPQWSFDVWQARAGLMPGSPEGYDGFVLTGSVSSVNDEVPWVLQLAGLVRQLHAQRLPTVGLCFGHQMMAHALGGRVGFSPGGWRVGSATTHISDVQPWMQPAQAAVTLFAAHQEQVLQPPAVARVVGGDAFTPAAALAVDQHFFSTQYHPEFGREFMRGLLQSHDGEWTAETVAAALDQVAQPVDAALFFRWMAQFLEQPRSKPLHAEPDTNPSDAR